MVDRFNAIADLDVIDFEAWFNDRIEPDRSWHVDETEWRFRYRYLPATSIRGNIFHWPIPILGRRPDLLVSLYAEPSFVCGWLIAKLRSVKTCFRVLMTHDRWVTRHWMKNAVKQFLFRRVDAVETPGTDGKNFAICNGVPAERVFLATHTVNIEYFEAMNSVAKEDRGVLRQQLGIHGTTYIYVGRLWWGKGVTYLLEAFQIVQDSSDARVSLLIVGDGPEESRLRQACAERGIRNVVFAGFQQKTDLPRYFAVADVFVFPTLGDPYGVVVDEAMVCSLPVISTSAAGEITSRVENDVNGYIVPPEDSSALADRMLHFVSNPADCERMGDISRMKVANHTPAQWAEDFSDMVTAILREKSI